MRSSSGIMLAIDTSTRTVGLALYDGVRVLSESAWTSMDYHTVELAPAVAEAFKKAGLAPGQLGALAVALGPGSFTGLRIGLALAKGLALARHLPIIGLPTLDILAAAQPLSDNTLVTIVHAGRGRLAVGWYQSRDGAWQTARPVEVCTPPELISKITGPTLVCGELEEEERLLFLQHHPHLIMASPAQSLRRAGYLAELAWRRWKSGQVDSPASLSPIYLHYNEPIPG